MTWNHRVIRHKDALCEYYYHIHEVHYNHNGDIEGWTEQPVAVVGSDPEDIERALKHMLKCLNKPVLEEIDGKLEEVE